MRLKADCENMNPCHDDDSGDDNSNCTGNNANDLIVLAGKEGDCNDEGSICENKREQE